MPGAPVHCARCCQTLQGGTEGTNMTQPFRLSLRPVVLPATARGPEPGNRSCQGPPFAPRPSESQVSSISLQRRRTSWACVTRHLHSPRTFQHTPRHSSPLCAKHSRFQTEVGWMSCGENPEGPVSCSQTLPAGITLIQTPCSEDEKLLHDTLAWKEGGPLGHRMGWFFVTPCGTS